MSDNEPKRRGRPPKARPEDSDETDETRSGVVDSPAAPPVATAPEPQTSAVAQVGAPVGISVSIPKPEPDTRKLYWIGLIKECPLEKATVGAVTFCQQTRAMVAVPNNPDTLEALDVRIGALARLNDDDLKKTLDAVSAEGIISHKLAGENRWRHSQGSLVVGAEPLAYYAWIAPVEEGFTPYAGSVPPATLAKRP